MGNAGYDLLPKTPGPFVFVFVFAFMFIFVFVFGFSPTDNQLREGCVRWATPGYDLPPKTLFVCCPFVFAFVFVFVFLFFPQRIIN